MEPCELCGQALCTDCGGCGCEDNPCECNAGGGEVDDGGDDLGGDFGAEEDEGDDPFGGDEE